MRAFFFFALCVAVARGQTLANLLNNGSFELPVQSNTVGITGGFTLSGGWSGVAPSNGGNAGLVVGVDNGLAPAAGNQHFCFNGGNPSDQGYIEQAFATNVGESYVVSFAVGRAGGGQALSLLASVLGNSSTIASLSAEPPGSRSYAYVSFSFTATSTSSTLRFADTSGGTSISDLYLDDVSVVSAIPEPAAVAAVLGLAALGVARLAKR